MRTEALTKEQQEGLTPESVLKDLMEGNERFVSKNMLTTDHSAMVQQTIKGQSPKAAILSCIDSRVPVEIVLDQAIGDIFVARVAGNFENTDILGSLEYACKVAGSKLILVLGHESCGAVKAACDGVELGNITPMLYNIIPAVRKTDYEMDTPNNDSSNPDFVQKTVENNVLLTIDRIREKSPILKEMEELDEIKIVGGVYSLKTGKVNLL